MTSAAATILSTSDLPWERFLFNRSAVGQPVPAVYFLYGTAIQQFGHDVTDAVGQIVAVLFDRHTDQPLRRIEVRRRHLADRELGLVRSERPFQLAEGCEYRGDRADLEPVDRLLDGAEMDDILLQTTAEGTGEVEIGHGIQFNPNLLGLENREAGGFGDTGRIAGDGEGLALISPEDHDEVIALLEDPVDRHMHHDVSDAAAKI